MKHNYNKKNSDYIFAIFKKDLYIVSKSHYVMLHTYTIGDRENVLSDIRYLKSIYLIFNPRN